MNRPEPSASRRGWDTHAHIFGPASRYPYAATRRYTPADQVLGDYLTLLDQLGLGNGVLIQPSVYGQDNSCLLNGLRAADGRLRGIVDLDLAALADSALDDLAATGVRGVRLWITSETVADDIRAIDGRLVELGWHFDLHFTSSDLLAPLADCLASLKAPVVIEAMGSVPCPADLTGAAVGALGRLMMTGRVWVKLSHPYQIDRSGPPYPNAVPLARHLVEICADQLLWGSDWPHPVVTGPMPGDALLLDLLTEWVGDIATVGRILNDNAVGLYI